MRIKYIHCFVSLSSCQSCFKIFLQGFCLFYFFPMLWQLNFTLKLICLFVHSMFFFVCFFIHRCCYFILYPLPFIKGPYDELEQSLNGTSIHSSLEPNVRGHSLESDQQTGDNSKQHVKEKTGFTSEMRKKFSLIKNPKVGKKSFRFAFFHVILWLLDFYNHFTK